MPYTGPGLNGILSVVENLQIPGGSLNLSTRIKQKLHTTEKSGPSRCRYSQVSLYYLVLDADS